MSFNVENIIQKVTDTLKTETVIGEPITAGEVTLIPIIDVSFGFGAGGGGGKPGGSQKGDGAGGGARMTVSGMVVVKGGEVSFLPTDKGAARTGPVDRILEVLPELMDKFSKKAGKPEDDKSPDEE